MKIVMSADWFYPAQVGGPSNTIYWQAKTLTQAGHDVTVVATAQDLPASVPRNRWLTLDCGRVMYTQNPHFYLPITHIWYGWQAIRTADVVHVHSLFYPASLVWIVLCQWLNKPAIWSPHGELSPAALQFRPRLKQFVLRLCRWCRSGILFQATCADEVTQIRLQVGSDVAVRELQTRMELPTPAVRVAQSYLLFVGRLHPIKAIDRLLEALSGSTVFRQNDFFLQIAGPDSDKVYTQRLKDLVLALNLAAKVSFIGAVQGKRKEQLYADAHLLILPSHAENFGNVVIESLAQGTPVVASAHTPWQILEMERVGRWVPNSPDSLRQAVEQFLTMPPDQYEQYRTRALALARREYDIAANPALLADFYMGVSRRNVPQQDGLHSAKTTP